MNTNQGYLQIGKNEETGRIENIEMHVGNTGAPIARVGEGHQFRGPIFEYVEDSFARVSGADYSVANTTEAITTEMKSVLESAYNLHDGDWVLTGAGWQYETAPSEYAQLGSTTSVSDNDGAMLDAIGWAKNFGKGKWITVGDDQKYLKYGDRAVYRMAETTDMDAATLAAEEATVKANKGIEYGHWNRIDETMDVVTLGGDIDGAGTALQYADFGHFNPVYKTKDIDVNGGTYGAWTKLGEHKEHTDEEVAEGFAAEDYQLFAGGYAIKGVNWAWTLDPEANTSYTGKAIGRVYTSIQGDNHAVRESHFAENGITSGDGHDIAKAYTTTHATMTIGADGTQTLVMPFNTHSDTADTFYDITITKNPDASIDLDFAGTPSDAEFQLYDAQAHMVGGQNTFSPNYYGVNTPSEAAGTARFYSEQDFGDGATREYELQAAWGMKKD